MSATYSRGGVYLARLNPAKGAEVGKLREGLINSSSRRRPGSSYLIFLDSRLRGNDDCRINQTFLRPVVVLTHQALLEVEPPQLFVCPLGSRSNPDYAALHVELGPRDSLRVKSYALVEHCRSVSVRRIQSERLAQLDVTEIERIVHKLRLLIGG